MEMVHVSRVKKRISYGAIGDLSLGGVHCAAFAAIVDHQFIIVFGHHTRSHDQQLLP